MKIEFNGNEATIGNQSVMLNPNIVTILKALYKADGKVISNAKLMKSAKIVTAHSLVQQVSTLRKLLIGIESVKIVTHPKAGYQLKITEGK